MTSPWQSPDPTASGQPAPIQPQYGEMAPPGYVSPAGQPQGVPVPGAPTYYAAPPVPRKSRTADVAVTCVLLGLGLVGMLFGLLTPLGLSDGLANEYAKYGLDYTNKPNLGAQGALIAISHVVLFLIALGVSIPLMVKRRIAFWVPLTTGVIAALIFWGVIIGIIAGDPQLMDAISAAR